MKNIFNFLFPSGTWSLTRVLILFILFGTLDFIFLFYM